jgi:alpha-N-arabinofuranosidase
MPAFFVQAGYKYNGSIWLKPEQGTVKVTFRVKDSDGKPVAEAPLSTSGSAWQEARYAFSSTGTDGQATVEIAAAGTGAILLDFISMMRGDVRKNGMLRPDLVEALRGLKSPFIRWPGGSFASIYKWKDGIGPHVSRKYHPNT